MSLNAATFAALGDPTRLAIVQQLTKGEASVLELAAPFALSQPAVSRHIKVLEQAGLITRRVDGQRRPCRLSLGALDEIDQWLAMLRRAMAANYDRLDQVLAEMQATERRNTP